MIDFDKLYMLRFEMETAVDNDDPDAHLAKYKVYICIHDDDGTKTNIGYFVVWRFNVEAYRNYDGHLLFDMFDADSQEGADLYCILYDVDSIEWKDELGIISMDSDILYFQWGEFPSEVALSTLTLAAAERIIQIIGDGCGIVALWPWDKTCPDPDNTTSEEITDFFKSQAEHENHWAKIGLNRIEGTSVLIRDLGLKGYNIRDIIKCNQ